MMFHQSWLHPVQSIVAAIATQLDRIEIQNPNIAHFFCRLIPAQCPFERDISCCGRILFHIPPLCKLNPFYDQLAGLRFRALTYLAESCGEDITV
jgi:hypothetical protein